MANASNDTGSRLTITFEVDGFPMALDFAVSAADMPSRVDQAIQAIQKAGGTPPRAAQVAAAAVAVPVAPTSAPGTPPRCQFHGPMKESTKAPGTWFCPAKMGDGETYCKEKFPAK